jgi:hypothetical protein
MIKTGVFASKRRIEHYEQQFQSLAAVSLAGYLDPDDPANLDPSGNLLYLEDLMQRVDAVIIDRYTGPLPAGLFNSLLKRGKHVMLDGFLLSDLTELHALKELNHEARVVFQVSGALASKPVFKAAEPQMQQVQLVKLEKFTPSLAVGNFARWLHFTTCNEIDLALRLIKSDVKALKAKPVFMFGNQPDLINVHAEFHNGAVFQMNFGRIPSETGCLMRVFSRDRYYKLHLDQGSWSECKVAETPQMSFDMDDVPAPPVNQLSEVEKAVPWFDAGKADLRHFADNILLDRKPETGLEELYNVSALIQQVKHQLSRNFVFE